MNFKTVGGKKKPCRLLPSCDKLVTKAHCWTSFWLRYSSRRNIFIKTKQTVTRMSQVRHGRSNNRTIQNTRKHEIHKMSCTYLCWWDKVIISSLCTTGVPISTLCYYKLLISNSLETKTEVVLQNIQQ